MGSNPWLAIDLATPPLQRARELHRAWEQFVDGADPAAAASLLRRAPIAASWARSAAAGVRPVGESAAELLVDEDEAAARWAVHPLSSAVPLIRELLGDVAAASGHMIVVSDADGTLLWLDQVGSLGSTAEALRFVVGGGWSEAGAGTNAIGTAIQVEHAVQVFASEHFNEAVQEWTCAAAPVRDPDSGAIVGVIDLTGPAPSAHPHSFAVAVATARATEAQLTAEMLERDGHLRARHDHLLRRGSERLALVTPTGRTLAANAGEPAGAARLVIPDGGGEVILPSGASAFAEPVGDGSVLILRERPRGVAPRRRQIELCLLGEDRPTVVLDGREVRLSRRHAELLALLTLHPGATTSEALAADLYGDRGTAAAARVEISRLRKVLGGGIDADSYSLLVDIVTDVGKVRALLARGAAREAAERYTGPLLPRSEAPGVVRERDELDAWVRHAVERSGDREALWAWVQSSSGHSDLLAWRRLLPMLEFRDPRRSQAAAMLESVRTELARPTVL